MNLINPAYAGSEGSHVFSMTSRNQWNTIDDSPKTTGFSYSMATSKNVGLGVSIISDKIFIENQTMLTIDFSYKLNRLFPKKISACPGAVVLRKNYPSLKEHCCRLYEFGNHNLKELGPQLQEAVIKQPCLLFINLNFLFSNMSSFNSSNQLLCFA